MKNNYPIKYAVIPMVEQVEWYHGMRDLEREFGIVCYIVTKCYVTSETKKYYQDGTSEIKYYVVCPFEYKEFDSWKRCEPSYNLIDGYCTNSTVTRLLFDSYDEAIKCKNEKNKILLEKKWVYLPYNEEFEQKRNKIIEEFNKTLDYYNQLEKTIEKKTPELKIDNIIKEQSVFAYQNGSLNHLYDSIYYLMKLYNNDDFKVFSVTDSQFEELKNGNTSFIKECFPLIIYDSKAKVMRLMNPGTPDKFINEGVIRDNYHGTLRRPDSNCISFYTLETYQDIIDSYQISNFEVNTIKLIRKK